MPSYGTDRLYRVAQGLQKHWLYTNIILLMLIDIGKGLCYAVCGIWKSDKQLILADHFS